MMIEGRVNTNKEAVIRLAVGGTDDSQYAIDAVVDTGFTGSLTLPPSVIQSLRLPWLSRQEGVLADGSVTLFDVYVAVVTWDGQPREVEVDEAETDPLIGMSLLWGFALSIQAKESGAVQVIPIN